MNTKSYTRDCIPYMYIDYQHDQVINYNVKFPTYQLIDKYEYFPLMHCTILQMLKHSAYIHNFGTGKHPNINVETQIPLELQCDSPTQWTTAVKESRRRHSKLI